MTENNETEEAKKKADAEAAKKSEKEFKAGKVWFTDSQKTTHRASVDGIKVPYGKANAVELSADQVKRLHEAGVTDLSQE